MSEQEIKGLLETLALRLDATEDTVQQVASNTVEMLSRWEKKKQELSSGDEMVKSQTDVSFHNALLEEDKKVKALPPVPRKPVKVVSPDLIDHNTTTFDSSPAARPIGVTVRGGVSVRGVTVRGGVSARGVSVRGGVAARGRMTTQ